MHSHTFTYTYAHSIRMSLELVVAFKWQQQIESRREMFSQIRFIFVDSVIAMRFLFVFNAKMKKEKEIKTNRTNEIWKWWESLLSLLQNPLHIEIWNDWNTVHNVQWKIVRFVGLVCVRSCMAFVCRKAAQTACVQSVCICMVSVKVVRETRGSTGKRPCVISPPRSLPVQMCVCGSLAYSACTYVCVLRRSGCPIQ